MLFGTGNKYSSSGKHVKYIGPCIFEALSVRNEASVKRCKTGLVLTGLSGTLIVYTKASNYTAMTVLRGGGGGSEGGGVTNPEA